MSSPAMKLVPGGPGSYLDELPTGATLQQDQFTIDSFLSAGGFGITYVARDSLARQVVIKECFPASFCRRSGQRVGTRSRSQREELRSHVTLFRQEAVNLAKLNHPNIVRVHQVFEENDTAYIAMDYIRGPDLLETIEGKALRLSPDRVIHLLDRMLDALGHVHAHGFLHRDIAPDNILLDAVSGEPVLIDFGASRKDETRKSRMLSGLRVVKDGYSPQEFYISGSVQTPCCDLYALAATFSHLITGEPPKTSRERLSAVASRQPDPQRPLLGRVGGYPQAFLSAIDKAMSIFPRDRLQSASDWQALLAAGGVSPAPAKAAGYAAAPAPMVSSALVAASSLSRDWLVRAAAASVLVAGLVSAAGNLYDRFWQPLRDSHLLILDHPPGLETAGTHPLRTSEISPETGRFGLELPQGAGSTATALDLAAALRPVMAGGGDPGGSTPAQPLGPNLTGGQASLTGEPGLSRLAAMAPSPGGEPEFHFLYNGLLQSGAVQPSGLPLSCAACESRFEPQLALGSVMLPGPFGQPGDFDENYLNARQI